MRRRRLRTGSLATARLVQARGLVGVQQLVRKFHPRASQSAPPTRCGAKPHSPSESPTACGPGPVARALLLPAAACQGGGRRGGTRGAAAASAPALTTCFRGARCSIGGVRGSAKPAPLRAPATRVCMAGRA